MPERPNNKINPRPTTKGGVMMGMSAKALRGLPSFVPLRSDHSANSVPKNVVPKAVTKSQAQGVPSNAACTRAV
jgi:hypothetical protein